jgi:hypothetical protein
MARYLSPEWVQSFDDALAALDLTEAIAAAGAGSLAAADGAFSVVQIVTEATSETHLVLTVAEGRAHLRLDPEHTATGTATIVLDHADARALALGALDPADALAEGRVRVRGDLAALVAGQEVLAAAAALLGPGLVELTDPTDPD